MRFLEAETQSALEQRAVRVRDFIWFTVRDRTTGDPFSVGYWSDIETIAAQIINPQTQQAEIRSFSAAAQLISITPIPLVSNLTVQSITIDFSQIADVNDLIRQYDARQGGVEIYRGLFNLDSMVQIAPAYPRFVGFIDEPDIDTPKENAEGKMSLRCVSHTQEMARSNPATRSDAHLRLRAASDDFRKHAAVVGSWDIRWGTAG